MCYNELEPKNIFKLEPVAEYGKKLFMFEKRG